MIIAGTGPMVSPSHLTCAAIRDTLWCKVIFSFRVPGECMELHEALRQITEIRQQMAHSEVFRGYRSITVGSQD